MLSLFSDHPMNTISGYNQVSSAGRKYEPFRSLLLSYVTELVTSWASSIFLLYHASKKEIRMSKVLVAYFSSVLGSGVGKTLYWALVGRPGLLSLPLARTVIS